MIRQYTQEQLNSLKSGYPQWPPRELAVHFNEQFGTDKTPGQLRSACKNREFKSGRSPGQGAKDRYLLVTAEQADYLRNMYQAMPLPELTEAFNKKYDQDLKKNQIRSFLKNHGITCSRSGHFGSEGKK
ncbi:MAG: hypothetical protein V7677_19515, partial [Motiliproteus sp.]